MSYDFEYDYFSKKRDGVYDCFEDEDEYDYEFSDELFFDENRYTDEFDNYDYD